MDIERQLSEHLNRAAGRASATPDLAEVELGSRRVRGRRRVVTGVAAAMLVAGAGGVGFGLGRGAGGSDAQVSAPADSGDPGTTAEGDATTTTIGNADTASQSDPANATAEATAAPVPAPPLGSPGTMSGQPQGRRRSDARLRARVRASDRQRHHDPGASRRVLVLGRDGHPRPQRMESRRGGATATPNCGSGSPVRG